MTIDYRWRAHYEPGVAHTVEVPDKSLPQLLAETAAAYPSHVAVRLVLRYLPFGLRIQAKLTYAQSPARATALLLHWPAWAFAKATAWRCCCPICRSK